MFDERFIEIEHCVNSNAEYSQLKNYSKLQQFQRFHCNDLSYNRFFSQFMCKNEPVIITGIADRWECMNWVKIENPSTFTSQRSCAINFDYLSKRIDLQLKVPIANCNKVFFNSHEKIELTLQQFLDYWRKQFDERNDANYDIGDDSKQPVNSDINANYRDLFYLKDWHLRRENPNYKFYTTPIYFTSDWLNEYCVEKSCDDYRFVYMGPKGTWTPFHVDVFSSYSWSTNIVGTKKWLFFPPGEEHKLKDTLGNLPFNLDDEKCKMQLQNHNVHAIEIIQNAGESVFVPSGWHHQVWNLEDTISINHNWFNGCNVYDIWLALHRSFDDILSEIDDCKDMEDFDGHCQLMLKAVFGLNYETFLDILYTVVHNRLEVLTCKLKSTRECFVNGVQMGRRHALFDLNAIRKVIINFQRKCDLEVLRKTSEKILLTLDQIE